MFLRQCDNLVKISVAVEYMPKVYLPVLLLKQETWVVVEAHHEVASHLIGGEEVVQRNNQPVFLGENQVNIVFSYGVFNLTHPQTNGAFIIPFLMFNSFYFHAIWNDNLLIDFIRKKNHVISHSH